MPTRFCVARLAGPVHVSPLRVVSKNYSDTSLSISQGRWMVLAGWIDLQPIERPMLFEHYHVKVTRKRENLNRSLPMDLSLGTVNLRVPLQNFASLMYLAKIMRIGVDGYFGQQRSRVHPQMIKRNRPGPDERIAAKRCAVCSPLRPRRFPYG